MKRHAEDPTWVISTKYNDIKRALRLTDFVREGLTPNINGKAALVKGAGRIETTFRLYIRRYKNSNPNQEE